VIATDSSGVDDVTNGRREAELTAAGRTADLVLSWPLPERRFADFHRILFQGIANSCPALATR
jgi:hypothetical protein